MNTPQPERFLPLCRIMGRTVFWFEFDPVTGSSRRMNGVLEDFYRDAHTGAVVFVVSLEHTSRLVAVPLDKVHLKEAKP